MPDAPAPKSKSFQSAARLGAKAARLAARLKASEAEKKALGDRVAELEKAPKADDVAKERDQAVGKLRARDHRAAFDKVADDLKIRKDARDDLWDLSKLDTSSDTPDASAIRSAIEGKVKDRAYLLEADAPAPKLNPGPGGDRGGKAPVVGEFRVPAGKLSDGEWMQANQDSLQAAQAEGRTIVYE